MNRISVKYHQQDKSFYCGAACTQMVLSQIGAPGRLDIELSQEALMRQIESVTTAQLRMDELDDGLVWYSHAEPLTQTIAALGAPVMGNRTFVLFALSDNVILSRKICWTIHNYGVPPVALVDDLHWVVVYAYEASADPAGVNDTTYVINGFWIQNPFPEYPFDPRPLPHATTDECGTGIDSSTNVNWGMEEEYVEQDRWFNGYLTKVPAGKWTGMFLTICDPEDPPKVKGPTLEESPIYSGHEFIDENIAADLAMKAVEQQGFKQKPSLHDQLQKLKPEKPVLVKWLDRPDDYFYIVPLRGQDSTVHALICIDALHGSFRQAAFPKVSGKFKRYEPLTRSEIISAIGNAVDLGKNGKHRIFPEAISIYPMMVFKFCRQSHSPYWPFHVVNIGHHLIYVRIDGRVFTRLTKNF